MTCRWAAEVDHAVYADVPPGTVACHRHPPVPMDAGGDGFATEWPMVDAFDFCGDHEPEP